MNTSRLSVRVRGVLGLAITSSLVLVAAAGLPGNAAPEVPTLVKSDDETTPVTHTGDAADEPTVWVNQANPGQSLILGNDKKGAFESYDLNGDLVQRITDGTPFWGNSDVRPNVTIGGFHGDLIAVAHGTGFKAYTVDAATRQLQQVNEGSVIGTGNPEGLCMYDSPGGTVYVTTLKREGAILRQFRLSDDDGNGQVTATQLRQFHVGGIAEGCVIDDANGAMYVSVEQVALWRYGAQPNSGQTRTLVDSLQPSGHLEHDIEGVALVTQPGGGGWLIASSQFFDDPGHSYFVVYDRQTNAYQKSFRIVKGTVADGCERTDGIAAYAGNLGPLYPKGIFVCQDNSNRAPVIGAQDFKYTKLDKILALG